ncbi:MAG: hypothetical protein HQ565_07850 [Bacteroidetes bacterium]|nr:hypothetical protein [Bacteroidota bacterium]
MEPDSTKIFISGSFDMGVSAGKIECRGMKGSALRDAWDEMHSFAEQYNNGRLGYE